MTVTTRSIDWWTTLVIAAVLAAVGGCGGDDRRDDADTAAAPAGRPAAHTESSPTPPAPPRFVDNADGTFTDRTTGLVWEKKCSGCGGPHDVAARVVWDGDGSTPTAWDWVARVNTESGLGLAGHRDWRVANVKELIGIAGAFTPADCENGCTDLTSARCNCTGEGPYWSSTTFAAASERAFAVDSWRPGARDLPKSAAHHVRAVRGGIETASAPAPPRSPPELVSTSGMPGLTVDEASRSLYWTDFATGEIRRTGLGGSGAVEAVAILEGPAGVAVGRGASTLYWTRAGAHPRAIGTVDASPPAATDRRRRAEPVVLVEGDGAGVPSGIAVDADGERLFWAEHGSGRIRSLALGGDAAAARDLVAEPLLSPRGLALDPIDAKLYFADFLGGRIVRTNLDGTGAEDVLTVMDGLDSPFDVAIDVAARTLYWTDPGARVIGRRSLVSGSAREVLDRSEGLLDPRAIAIDASHVYWTDNQNGTVSSATHAGEDIRVVVEAGPAQDDPISCVLAVEPVRGGDAAARRCEDALGDASLGLVRDLIGAGGVCLEKLAALKAVRDHAAEIHRVAPTCARQLATMATSGTDRVRGRWIGRVRAACKSRGRNDDLSSALPGLSVEVFSGLGDDMFRKRCAPVPAGALGDPKQLWLSCVADTSWQGAIAVLARRFPRAAHRLRSLRPFIESADPGERTDSGLFATYERLLEALDEQLPERGAVADLAARRPRAQPESGQRIRYQSDLDDGWEGADPIDDDGATQAGAPLAYRDNGDGTLTDLVTGLVWEKKCRGCGGPHDADARYDAPGALPPGGVDAWLESINTAALAGHDDWRLPTAGELTTLVDYGRFHPAVRDDLHRPQCARGCPSAADPSCSCTGIGRYWAADRAADDAGSASAVSFADGRIEAAGPEQHLRARAVRHPGRSR